jgi:hypothetical protein
MPPAIHAAGAGREAKQLGWKPDEQQPVLRWKQNEQQLMLVK